MRRPKVKLDNLIAFMTVAAKHNIGDAADELGLSASGVRKQIENIEGTLGLRLFESSRGNLILTEEGKLFHEDAKKAVDQALLAEEQLAARREIKDHHLLVGHSTNLPSRLIAAIAQIQIEDVQPVRIEHRSGLTSTTVRGVIEGSLHAGFGILPIRAPELLIRTIYEEPLVACIPVGHRLASKPALSPPDFDGEPIIAIAREPWPERHREIDDYFAGFGIALRVTVDAYSALEALAYVDQKIGICLLPSSSVVCQPGVATKPFSPRGPLRRCGVFIREDNRSPLLQKLLDASLRMREGMYPKRGPVAAPAKITAWEDFRKAGRIFQSSPKK